MRVLPIVLVLAGGCSIIGESPPATWVSTSPLTKPRAAYMPAMKGVVERAGFKIETFDDAQVSLRSDWRVQLRPQWRQGFRERVHMRLAESDKREPIISVQVERDRNENSSRPMSAENAEWLSWGSNDDLGQALAYRLKLKIEGIGVDD